MEGKKEEEQFEPSVDPRLHTTSFPSPLLWLIKSLLLVVSLHHGDHIPHALETGLVLITDHILELLLLLRHLLDSLEAALNCKGGGELLVFGGGFDRLVHVLLQPQDSLRQYFVLFLQEFVTLEADSVHESHQNKLQIVDLLPYPLYSLPHWHSHLVLPLQNILKLTERILNPLHTALDLREVEPVSVGNSVFEKLFFDVFDVLGEVGVLLQEVSVLLLEGLFDVEEDDLLDAFGYVADEV